MQYDFKAGMTVEAPEGLEGYGDTLVAETVANVLGTALALAGFTVVSLTAKGGPKSSVAHGTYVAPEVSDVV